MRPEKDKTKLQSRDRKGIAKVLLRMAAALTALNREAYFSLSL